MHTGNESLASLSMALSQAKICVRVRKQRSILRTWICAGVLFVPIAHANPAQQPCTEGPDECGRIAFDAGVQAYQAESYEEALEHFQEAYRHKPHPAIGLNLALAEAKNGLLLEAIRRLEGVINHPQASENVRDNANRERNTIQANLAVLVLEVEGNVVAMVNGQPVTGTPPTVRLNPGIHHVKVMEGTTVLLERTVALRLAERLRIAVQRTSETTALPEVLPKPTSPTGLDPVWVYAGAGVTVAFGALTLWSGIDTQRAFNEYERELPRLPQAEIDRRVDEGHGKELRTNLLLGATFLAAAGTTVLGVWFVDWGSEAHRNQVGITPGGVRFQGSF